MTGFLGKKGEVRCPHCKKPYQQKTKSGHYVKNCPHCGMKRLKVFKKEAKK